MHIETPARLRSPIGRLDLEDRLLRADEVAHLIGISPRAVWKLRSTGTLPPVGIWTSTRFRLSDVRRLIREGVPA